jgi:hypothetical protein
MSSYSVIRWSQSYLFFSLNDFILSETLFLWKATVCRPPAYAGSFLRRLLRTPAPLVHQLLCTPASSPAGSIISQFYSTPPSRTMTSIICRSIVYWLHCTAAPSYAGSTGLYYRLAPSYAVSIVCRFNVCPLHIMPAPPNTVFIVCRLHSTVSWLHHMPVLFFSGSIEGQLHRTLAPSYAGFNVCRLHYIPAPWWYASFTLRRLSRTPVSEYTGNNIQYIHQFHHTKDPSYAGSIIQYACSILCRPLHTLASS